MANRWQRLKLHIKWLALSLVYATVFLIVTGLIPLCWGRWYSSDYRLRRQTDVMLHGAIALDDHPESMYWDLCWAKGKVQHPWGLGVPSWRLIFEWLAEIRGYSAFPDRFALGIAFLLILYLGMSLSGSDHHRPGAVKWMPALSQASLPLWMLLFPPFISLCRSRVLVYEEVAIYTYLYSILLVILLLGLLRRPSTWRYMALSATAGVGPFVRPTLVFYCVATMCVAAFWCWKHSWGKKRIWLGIAVFLAGGGLLFFSNWQRFGSGWEFGHQLTVNTESLLLYMTRFDVPYRDEPILSAIHELLALLFFSGHFEQGIDTWSKHYFPGTSDTLRWREMYFTTYDLLYFTLILLGWVWMPIASWRRRAAQMTAPSDELSYLAAWSILSGLLVFAFYLRFPFIASRYLIDFAPAFAVGMWVAARGLWNSMPERWRVHRACQVLAVALVLAGWVYELHRCQTALLPDLPDTFREMMIKMEREKPTKSHPPLPAEYTAGMDLEDFNIPFNGLGWYPETGDTQVMVGLFVEQPEFLELELVRVDGTPLTQEDCEKIRAKVQLEYLVRESISQDGPVWRVRFKGPASEENRRGIQMVFVALVDNSHLTHDLTGMRLAKVRWRNG